VILLMILFAFGLFFSPSNGPHGLSLPFNVERDPIPEVIPNRGKIFTAKSFLHSASLANDERAILDYFSVNDPSLKENLRNRFSDNHNREEIRKESTVAPTRSLLDSMSNSLSKYRPKNNHLEQNEIEVKKQKKQPLKKISLQDDTMVKTENTENSSLVHHADDDDAVNGRAFVRDPNTSYLLCSDVKELVSAEMDQKEVSLLIPTYANRTRKDHNNNYNTHLGEEIDSVIEVTCKAVNYNLYTVDLDKWRRETVSTSPVIA